MTDLEIIRLCADAMGLDVKDGSLASEVHGQTYFVLVNGNEYTRQFNPLYDDAQAMALVKRFPQETYAVFRLALKGLRFQSDPFALNRAICECVAKMQNNK